MATNTGKVVGARLPMANYLNIVAKAAEMKMTVSDFVLLKLFAPADPSALPLHQARQQVEQLTAKVTTLETEKTGLLQNNQAWKQYADTLKQAHQEATQQAQTTAQQHGSQQQAQIDKLTQQVTTERNQRAAAQKKLEDLREALADAHDSSVIVGHMGEKYWTIIDHFIPPKSTKK